MRASARARAIAGLTLGGALLVLSAAGIWTPAQAQGRGIVVGSKSFTENYVLGEVASQLVEEAGEGPVTRKFGMGGTGFLYRALTHGDIDVYPEYTGTISQAILKWPGKIAPDQMRRELERRGLVMIAPLGFNNTYALAVRRSFALEHGLTKISDLKRLHSIRAGFSYEFMKRQDGFLGLVRRYGLKLSDVRGMEHSLAYEGMGQRQIDLTDIYSTDAKIGAYDLVLLKDDLGFFPTYDAVWLARAQFVKLHPKSWAALKRMEGTLSEQRMSQLNAQADLQKRSFPQIAAGFLNRKAEAGASAGVLSAVWLRTRQHLYLVFVSLWVSVLAGVPLGVLAVRSRWLGQMALLLSGLVQTIPSLALLCFLIPVFGIGQVPALIALFLYGLLPIVLNTYNGMRSIDPKLLEVSRALGLSPTQRLRLIELPLASRNILGGIKTSAIVSVGTATLAALIGAGGYGAPIVSGLALNDSRLILQGAVPAALMALCVHALFEAIERVLVPRGLR